MTAAGMLLLLIALSSSIRQSRVFPEEVQQYRLLVEHYARKEGIRNCTDDLLAIMTVESGGRLEDLMQSSESLGLAPDTLDSESSIAQGCSYYASLLKRGKKHRVDEKTVFQAYNYGPGYITYVEKNGGVHSRELAERFAERESGGKKKTYSNPLAVEANGGWRYAYGNMFYAELVDAILKERRKEKEPGMMAELLILLTAAAEFFFAGTALFRTGSRMSLRIAGIVPADLKRKGIPELLRARGFISGAAALLLIYGFWLSYSPAEFCGAVLLADCSCGIYEGLTGRPSAFLLRGLLPLLTFLAVLSGSGS